ncbi:hypothetical protein [Pseudomonas sp. Marseille-Q0931]|uniref:hypothetical protein n=1 Tax=Pseudomonas sp. Marseille-Q0931 TaxID=2697507 RepID=UPI0023BA38C0|nr:hypothetical protein [Pseudomonas sp. Marseille-Q0931]
MDHTIRYLTQHLPGHDVLIKARPDGKILMSFSKNGSCLYMKAIDPCSLISEADLDSLVEGFKLDRKLISGNIHKEDIEKKLLHNALPTFSGHPINPTAAKMLWKRRQTGPHASR